MNLPRYLSQCFPVVRHRRKAGGFSLVEVTIAMAIVAFALISIIGLLPAGVGISNRAAMNTTSAQIFERLVGDAHQTDFSKLVYPSNNQAPTPVTTGTSFRLPNLRYFDDLGAEVIPANPASLSDDEKAKVVYHVNTRILTNALIPADKAAYVGQFLANVTFQIARNPGNLTLSFTPDGLIVPVPGMDIRSKSIQVAKND